MGTRLWPASNVLVQYLDSINLEGERVLDFHRAQLELCQMPAARVRKVIVRCRPRESAASAVLRAVKDADAVVCGSRGLGAAQKALLGVAGVRANESAQSGYDKLLRGLELVRDGDTERGSLVLYEAAADLEFETAARLRDEIKRLQETELAVADDPFARQSEVDARVSESTGKVVKSGPKKSGRKRKGP